MKSSSVKLTGILKPIEGFLRRFHTILFFLAVSGGLFVAIMILISIVNVSADTAKDSDNVVDGTFDEQTIQRIQQDTTTTVQPSGRPSPFVE